MTAAHCVREKHFSANPEKLVVVVGDKTRFVNERTERTHSVCKISVHQDYNYSVTPSYDHDIALLHLCCCIKYGPWARPVCLPEMEDEVLIRKPNGEQGTVVGWGATNRISKENEEIMFVADQRQVHLPLVDDCKNMRSTTENMFCAGDGTGTRDACFGDSGSPFLSQRLAVNDARRPYVVTGIVSWGSGCGQPNTYGVYTNVIKYREWIQAAKDSYEIDCETAECKVESIV